MGEAGIGEPYSTLTLKDGRKLAYLDVGASGGPAVLHFHGHGSSRLEALMLEDAAHKYGLRVIAFDRPGIGYSDPKTGDRLRTGRTTWRRPRTARHRAFAVQGMSAGGPYALACAHKIPNRSPPAPGERGADAEVAKRGTAVRRLLWWAARSRTICATADAVRPDARPSEEAVRRMQRVALWLGGGDLHLMQSECARSCCTMLEPRARTGPATGRDRAAGKPWASTSARSCPALPVAWRRGPHHAGAPAAHGGVLHSCTATFYEGEGISPCSEPRGRPASAAAV